MSRFWLLIAPEDHPLADAVQLILSAKDQKVERSTAGPLPVLVPPAGLPFALQDTASLLAALAPEGAIAPALLTGFIRALPRLAALDPAAFPSDLDLQIYALRQELRQLEDLAPGHPEAPAALLLAPLLWRIGLIDRHFDLYLLSGLPRLAALLRAQSGTPLICSLFDTGAQLRHLKAPTATPLPRTDWSRALGPEGREKSLLPAGQRRKNPSIGSEDRFR